MKVWSATEDQIRQAAETAGVRIPDLARDGRAFRFVLRTDGTGKRLRWGRVSRHIRNRDGSPRRIPGAVCWHGHRAFMRAVLALAPDARIKSGLADYRGSADFEARHGSTFGHGNGYNVAYGASCDCEAMRAAPEPATEFGRLDRNGYTKVRTLSRSALLACPHVILVPEHYREDGSCRCDDATSTDMAEWGYTWDAAAKRWT